jgi:hypothetical protein
MLRRFFYFALGVSLAFFCMMPWALAGEIPSTFWGQTNGTYYTGNTAGNITTYSLGPTGYQPLANSADAGLTWSKPSITTGAASFSAASGGGVNAAQNVQLAARGATATLVQTIKFPPPTIAGIVSGVAKRTIPGIALTVVAPYLLTKGLQLVDDQWMKEQTSEGGSTATSYLAYFPFPTLAYNSQCTPGTFTGTTGQGKDQYCAQSLAYNTATKGCLGDVTLVTCDYPNGGTATRVQVQTVHGLLTGTQAAVCPNGGTAELVGGVPMCVSSSCPAGQVRNAAGECVAGGLVPATDSDIDAAATQVANDPATAVPQVQALSQNNLTLDPSTPMTLTTPGPVTTPSTTQTVSGPTGTTTTTSNQTITFNHGGDTITNSNFTTSIVNNTTTTTDPNVTTTDPTTTDTDVDSYSDTPFAAVPTLYEQKYPDGIEGVWNDNKDSILQSAFFESINSLIPTFSGGSCPNFGLNLNIASWASYGTQSFPVPCWVYDAIGLILLVTAAFTARAIVFGG